MIHGYSLRPNSKGRQRNQSTKKTKEQVDGTSANTSTSTSSPSEGRHKTLTDELEGESGTVDPRPATPDTPRAAHNSPPAGHSRSILSHVLHHYLQPLQQPGIGGRGPTGTRNVGRDPSSTQARGSKTHYRSRPHTARTDRAWVRGGAAHDMRARIVALRRECEVKVERVKRKRGRDWAIERGEVVVVVEDGDGDERDLVGSEDADGETMEVEKNTHTRRRRSLDRQAMTMPSNSGSGLIAPRVISHHHHHHHHQHASGKPNSSSRTTTKGSARGDSRCLPHWHRQKTPGEEPSGSEIFSWSA